MLIYETLPKAKIYCLINTNLKSEIANGYKKITEHFSVKPIEFKNISKFNGHPTIQGMLDIKNELLEKL